MHISRSVVHVLFRVSSLMRIQYVRSRDALVLYRVRCVRLSIHEFMFLSLGPCNTRTMGDERWPIRASTLASPPLQAVTPAPASGLSLSPLGPCMVLPLGNIDLDV